ALQFLEAELPARGRVREPEMLVVRLLAFEDVALRERRVDGVEVDARAVELADVSMRKCCSKPTHPPTARLTGITAVAWRSMSKVAFTFRSATAAHTSSPASRCVRAARSIAS